MKEDVKIIIAEDDDGHFILIQRNLNKAGIINNILRFSDGEQLLNYLYSKEFYEDNKIFAFILLLDIRMPKVDGIEVLRKIKEDKNLKKIPVIMLTTTNDPDEVKICHELGCNNYITKPVDYENFCQAIQRLGFFLKIVEVPTIN